MSTAIPDRLKEHISWVRSHNHADVDKLTGKEFEDCVGAMFAVLGYVVQATEYFDFGADLIITKAGIRTGVQAKRHASSIGTDAVRSAVRGRSSYQCDKAAVITNSYFQRDSRKLAEREDVILWAREELEAMLLAAHMLVEPLAQLPSPKCRRHDVTMLTLSGQQGPYWRCPSYGNGCHSSSPVRNGLVLTKPQLLAA